MILNTNLALILTRFKVSRNSNLKDDLDKPTSLKYLKI